MKGSKKDMGAPVASGDKYDKTKKQRGIKGTNKKGRRACYNKKRAQNHRLID